MRYAIFTFAALNLAWYIAIAIAPPSFRETAGEGWVIFFGMILAAFHLPPSCTFTSISQKSRMAGIAPSSGPTNLYSLSCDTRVGNVKPQHGSQVAKDRARV